MPTLFFQILTKSRHKIIFCDFYVKKNPGTHTYTSFLPSIYVKMS